MKAVEKTLVSAEEALKFQPWLSLDPNRDTTGLAEGEDSVFESLQEKAEHYQQALYGRRFCTAIYLKPEREFNQMMFVKALVSPGDKLLLIGEALEAIGLVELGQQTVGADVEIVPLEMRPMAGVRHAGQWGIYRELTMDYEDGGFDAVIAAQWHHCDDLVPEFKSLARIVKPGGKLVLVDNGPGIGTFELAKQDAILNWLLRMFVTWAGSRHVPIDQAYEHQKGIWLARPLEEVIAAAQQVLRHTRAWEYKGMAIIDGVREH